MGKILTWAVASLAIALSVRADEGEQQKIERVPCKSTDGKITVLVPKAWMLEVEEPNEDICGLNTFGELEVNGRLESIWVRVYLLGTANGALHQAQTERTVHVQAGNRAELKRKPAIALERYYKKGKKEYVTFSLYRLQKGQCVTLVIDAPVAILPALRDEGPAIFASMRSTHGHFPTLPPVFKASSKHGMKWHVQDAIKKKQLRPYLKVAKDLRKRFARIHGKRSRPHADQVPRVVAVSNDPMAVAIHSKTEMKGGIGSIRHTGWVFVRPMMNQASIERYTSSLTESLYLERYGTLLPYWASYGENVIAVNEARAGARLPIAPQSFIDEMAITPIGMRKLIEDEFKETPAPDSNYVSAKLWVAFFHAGPAKYRKAYIKFLQTMSETGDIGASFEKHFGSFNDDAMRSDLITWRDKKLKAVKKKK